jgi:hypothetical protein
MVGLDAGIAALALKGAGAARTWRLDGLLQILGPG